MKRLLIFSLLTLTVLLLFAGCNSKQSEPLTTLYTYEKGNRTFTYDFLYGGAYSGLGSSLDWIKANTPPDAVFLCWWDYGHSIRNFGQRDVIIFSPSRESIDSHCAPAGWNVEKSGDLAPMERTQDVSAALLAVDPNITAQIMHKYNSAYIFIYQNDTGKSWAMYCALGKPRVTPIGTVLSKASNKEDIQNFELVYSDQFVRIYKLIE